MKTQTFHSTNSKSGFNLLELIVLVAVVSVLAFLFFAAAFGRARQHSSETGCLNNLRRLTLGWQMYASDNHGILPVNGDEGDQPSGLGTLSQAALWCPGQMDSGAPSGAPTNTAWIKAGQIFPYVGDTRYYHCPADVSTYRGAVFPSGGSGAPRLRSYSMNAWIGPSHNAVSGALGSEANYYRVYRQETDLAVPGPANIFLLIDENPYTINDGFFWQQPTGQANLPTATSWNDIPAIWHAGGVGVSFADCHTQIRKWTDANLLAYRGGFLLNASAPRTDLLWLLSRTTAHK